jgi:hypothetical protein
MNHIALLENTIICFNNTNSNYYKPLPSYINVASCLYNNKLYILCKNNEQYILRKIIIQEPHSIETYETIDMILLPEDDIYHDIWMNEHNLFIISNKCLIEIILDETEHIILQMKKYELFSESNLLIDSFTYQDGYYYVLAYQPNDELQSTYTNYIFIFNKNFEYKQVYSLPYTEKCKHLRYYSTNLLFIKGPELLKYNFISNESDIFIRINTNTDIKTFYISNENEILCLLQNPHTKLSCDVCKITMDEFLEKKYNYMYFEKLHSIIKQVLTINYVNDVLLPSSPWKKSYIKHIDSQENITINTLCSHLMNIYKNIETYKSLFYEKKYETSQVAYMSLDDFISITKKNLFDIQSILPSYNGLQPKQLKYDIVNNDEISNVYKLYEFIKKENIRVSGHYLYDSGHNLGWHTNLDNDYHLIHNKRRYIVINQHPFGSSFFLYKHPKSHQIHIVPDDNLCILEFSFGTKEEPLWHAVYCKEGLRMSFGQIIE